MTSWPRESCRISGVFSDRALVTAIFTSLTDALVSKSSSLEILAIEILLEWIVRHQIFLCSWPHPIGKKEPKFLQITP